MINYKYKNKDGEYASYVLVIGNEQIINPTEEQYASQGYFPYTPEEPSKEEIEKAEIEAEIEWLKEQLAITDYIAIKAFEEYDCDNLYPGWKQDRHDWRDRINELENLLKL